MYICIQMNITHRNIFNYFPKCTWWTCAIYLLSLLFQIFFIDTSLLDHALAFRDDLSYGMNLYNSFCNPVIYTYTYHEPPKRCFSRVVFLLVALSSSSGCHHFVFDEVWWLFYLFESTQLTTLCFKTHWRNALSRFVHVILTGLE